VYLWRGFGIKHGHGGTNIILRLVSLSLPPEITFLSDTKFDAFALGQRYPRLDTLSNDENVCHPSGECPVQGVLHVDNVETTNMLLPVHDDTSPAHVASTSDHDDIPSIKFDKISYFVLFNVKPDSIVDLNERIRVANSSTIMSNDVRNATCTKGDFADFAKLVGSFFRSDEVNSETALDVVEETEVFTRFFDRYNVHESSGVGGISPNLSVNFDETLSNDGCDLATSQSIL